MILKRFQRIYEQEPFILRVRALYLFLFNLVTFIFPGITYSIFIYEGELTYRPSFVLLISASFLSMLLLWNGRFKSALIVTLTTILVGITLGMLFGDSEGNVLYSFPTMVIIFLLFTNIRTTIFISLYSFVLIFWFLYLLSQKGVLKTVFAVDSVLGFFIFTVIAFLTVNLLNSYIKEKDELIKEIHHRVRNNLQVLCGLVDLHRGDKSDSEKILFEFQNRILAMSEVHNYMYKSDNYHKIEFSNVIERIIENLKDKHKDLKVSIRNYSDRIDLPIETAIPCAMIFNELLNNSLNHAFKESQDPNVEIRFSKSGGNYKLIIKDNGVGMSTPVDLKKPNTTGFTLVHILSKQIRADFELFNDRGLVAVLKF
ncbi:histidine kinase [Leptospira santarosai str. CBC1416]|uniref:histidine kinase n=1 Tax=Leptospira santarosai str. CBC1416 TaxID=1193059 RepID=M6W5D6_9LEPT|nr:histidine kinase [Leptospira santarosai str. CBC1416]